MWTVLIILILMIYSFFVIRKKVKDMKAGKFCSCDCGHCSAKCNQGNK